MKIMTVDMDKPAVSIVEEPAGWAGWWGRGLIARILLDEVDPACEPLGPGNVFILTRGPLAGTGITSASRTSAGGKSPLTGGVKEANAGGNFGEYLGRLGLKAIIARGQASRSQFYILEVSSRGDGRLEAADDIRDLGVYDMADVLRQRYGANAALALNGPSGTGLMNLAGVMCTDREGVPNRAAARGGLGTVMASRGLKAVVLASPEVKTPIADEDGFAGARLRLNQAALEHVKTNSSMQTVGTAGMVSTTQHLGALPTRNFTSGQFELADNIKGSTVYKTITERGGRTGHPCMAGCIIRCSNIFRDKEGNEVVRALEYETLAMMGSNLGIGDLDAIARFNRECNDLGIDTIETGVAIGIAMDAGLWKFGDISRVDEALKHIRDRDILGRVLGAGAAITGKVLGWHRVPVVKGQGIAAYDPRAVKGMGVGYATSPMGADHTAGHTIRYKVDHHSPEGQVQISRDSQASRAAIDTLGLCSFASGTLCENPGDLLDAINSVAGTAWVEEDYEGLGKECLTMETEFNRRAGFTPAHDRLPEFCLTEKLPPYDLVFDVSQEEMEKVFEFPPK